MATSTIKAFSAMDIRDHADPGKEVASDHKKRIVDHLLETPFKWRMTNPAKTSEEIIASMTSKKSRKDEDEGHWLIFVVSLGLCYEMTRKGERKEAYLHLDDCQAILEEEDVEEFVLMYRDVFQNLLTATRDFIDTHPLYDSDDDVPQACDPPVVHGEGDQHTLAGINGIHAAVLMEYGYSGTCEALDYLKIAIQLAPDVAEWHFLYGKCLGRRRHVDAYHEVLELRELTALETAVELAPENPYYRTFLAQAYREAARSMADEPDEAVQRQVKRMLDRALELYEQALSLKPNCPFINVRCAQGYMRFNQSHRNLDLAYECCARAITAQPDDVMINHVWGQINDRLRHVAVALAALEKAGRLGAFGARMDWTRLRTRTESGFDALPHIEEALTVYADVPGHRMSAQAQLVSCLYFVVGDVKRSLDCLVDLVNEDASLPQLVYHMPVGFIAPSFNLLALVLVEFRSSRTEPRAGAYRSVREVCEKRFPELLADGAADEVLQRVQKASARWRNQRGRPAVARSAQESRSDRDKDWRRSAQAPSCRSSLTQNEEDRMGKGWFRQRGCAGSPQESNASNKQMPWRRMTDHDNSYLSWRARPKMAEAHAHEGGGDSVRS